jgi:hypothetical protein
VWLGFAWLSSTRACNHGSGGALHRRLLYVTQKPNTRARHDAMGCHASLAYFSIHLSCQISSSLGNTRRDTLGLPLWIGMGIGSVENSYRALL